MDQLSPTNAFKHIENGCHWIKTTNSVNYVQFILEREQVENHLHASLSRHLKLPPSLVKVSALGPRGLVLVQSHV